MKRRVVVSVVSVLVLVGAIGTGIAGADVSSLSKEEYIKAADDICRQGNELSGELGQEHFGDLTGDELPSEEQLEAFAQELGPIWRQIVGQLRGLPKPEGDEKTLKKLYKQLTKEFKAFESDPSVEDLVEQETVTPKADKLSQKYGFEVCGV
jgi:hypothetical protein